MEKVYIVRVTIDQMFDMFPKVGETLFKEKDTALETFNTRIKEWTKWADKMESMCKDDHYEFVNIEGHQITQIDFIEKEIV